jgi:hypothetical protein
MPKMSAYCGLTCSNCPTFIATQNDDDDAREKTVTLYAQKFGLVLRKEDINCDGCLARVAGKSAIARYAKSGNVAAKRAWQTAPGATNSVKTWFASMSSRRRPGLALRR